MWGVSLGGAFGTETLPREGNYVNSRSDLAFMSGNVAMDKE
jgi:hypothetical protein